jgi:hypothetical protein
MQIRWTKAGHTKEEVLRFRPAFEALKEILETDFKKKEADRDYSPGWEHRQIAINEYNSVLNDILKLITIEKE